MNKYDGYTPGPWYVAEYRQDVDADRSIMARRKVSGHPMPVGRAYGEGVLSRPSPERIANARLMADAPMLLEQNQTLATALRQMLDCGCADCDTNARATLATIEEAD